MCARRLLFVAMWLLCEQKYLVDKHIRFVEDEIIQLPKVAAGTINPVYAPAATPTPGAKAKPVDVLIAPNEEQAARTAMNTDLSDLQSGALAVDASSKKARKAAAKAEAAAAAAAAARK